MSVFLGQYDFVIDDKRRVNVPSKFRDALPQTEKQLAILKGSGGCLVMYPVDALESVMSEFNTDHFSNDDAAQKAQRQKLEASSIERPDSQGRIPLTARQMEHAGLTKKSSVIFFGAYKRIEIWSPEAFAKHMGSGDNES